MNNIMTMIAAVVVTLIAVRVITAICFNAGRKTGQAAVFAALKAMEDAKQKEEWASEALASARGRKEQAESKRKEEGHNGRSVRKIVRRVDCSNWMRSIEVEEVLSYEHRAEVERQAVEAAEALTNALNDYNAAVKAKNEAKEALQALK